MGNVKDNLDAILCRGCGRHHFEMSPMHEHCPDRAMPSNPERAERGADVPDTTTPLADGEWFEAHFPTHPTYRELSQSVGDAHLWYENGCEVRRVRIVDAAALPSAETGGAPALSEALPGGWQSVMPMEWSEPDSPLTQARCYYEMMVVRYEAVPHDSEKKRLMLARKDRAFVTLREAIDTAMDHPEVTRAE
jgi:hypothetical protein